MTQVNVFDAKSNLSALIRTLEEGEEDVVVIARHGKPIVRMTLCEQDVSSRIGIAGAYELVAVDWDIHEGDQEVAELFGVA